MEEPLKALNKAMEALYALIFTIVLVLIIALTIFYSDIEKLSNFGGFIGGVLGTLIAGVVFIYVKKTYNLQEQELRSTKEYIKKQQFESTFFNMLTMVNNIIDSISYNYVDAQNTRNVTARGNDFFKYFMERLKENNKSIYDSHVHFNNSITREINKIDPENTTYQFDFLNFGFATGEKNILPDPLIIGIWKNEHPKEFVGLVYKYWYLQTDTQLGHLFRYIYNTMTFVIDSWDDFETQKRYIKLIQAQLSNYQLAVMFYSGISPVSRNSKGEYKFREIADKFGIFQNMEATYLLDESHFEYYPETKFKNR
ncbi:MAG: hypothetical protein FGM41_04315 [Bacteroidetes bacterium]|nr:hypothetical protein [Bacteroidota bacterium]